MVKLLLSLILLLGCFGSCLNSNWNPTTKILIVKVYSSSLLVSFTSSSSSTVTCEFIPREYEHKTTTTSATSYPGNKIISLPFTEPGSVTTGTPVTGNSRYNLHCKADTYTTRDMMSFYTAPNILTGVNVSMSTNSAILSWNPSFPMEYPRTQYIPCIIPGSCATPLTTTSINYSNLNMATQYTFEVKANNVAGDGDVASIRDATLIVSPTSVSIISSTLSNFTVSWSMPSIPGNDFTVYRVCLNPGTICKDETSSIATSTSFTSGLIGNTVYTASVEPRSNKNNATAVTAMARTPPAPPVVTVSSITQTSALVSWIDPTPEVTHVLCVPILGCNGIPQTSPVNLTSFVANTVYSVYVRSTSTITGLTVESNSVSFITLPNHVATAPTMIARTTTAIHLQWNIPRGNSALIYNYEACCTPVGSSIPICANTTSSMPIISQLISPLDTNSKYSCFIKTSTSAGAASNSPSKNYTVIPTAPTAITQTTGLATVNSVTLSWLGPIDSISTSGPFTYRVCQWNGSAAFGCTNADTFTNITYSNLSISNSAYTFVVMTMDSTGQNSTFSPPMKAYTAPNTPTNPTVVARPDANSILFNWVHPGGNFPGNLTYTICCNDATAVSPICQSFVGTTGLLYGLVAGTIYTCNIKAASIWGTSATSIGATRYRTLPPTPSVASISQTSATVNSITLSWSTVTGGNPTTESYSYRVCTIGKTNCVNTSTTGITTATLSGAIFTAANTEYQLEVYAVDATESLDSLGAIFIGTTAPNSVTAAPSVEATTISSIKLSWFAPYGGNAKQYDYEACCKPVGYSTPVCATISSVANSVTQVVSPLPLNTLYNCYIRTSTTAGTASDSPFVTIRVSPTAPTALTQNIATTTSSSISVYWNALIGGNSTSGPYTYQLCKYNSSIQLTTDCQTFGVGSTAGNYSVSLSANRQYTLIVRAIDDHGIGQASAISNILTAFTLAEDPTSLHFVDRSDSSTIASWTSDNSQSSVVCMSWTSVCTDILANTILLSQLNSSCTYSVTIYTKNIAGMRSLNSVTGYFSTLPKEASNVKQLSGTENSVKLQWKDTNYEATINTWYHVCVDSKCQNVTSNTNHPYSEVEFDKLQSSEVYNVTIVAQNSAEDASNIVMLKVMTGLKAPVLEHFVNGADFGIFSLSQLVPSSTEFPTLQLLFQLDIVNLITNTTRTITQSGLTFFVYELAPETAFDYSITPIVSLNGATITTNESLKGNFVTLKGARPSAPPRIVNVIESNNGQVTLILEGINTTNSGNARILEYQVEYTSVSTDFNMEQQKISSIRILSIQFFTSQGNATISELSKGTTYYIRARGRNYVGFSDYSTTLKISISLDINTASTCPLAFLVVIIVLILFF